MNESKDGASAYMTAVIAYRNLLTIADQGDQETAHLAFTKWHKAESRLPTKVRAALTHERVEAHIGAWTQPTSIAAALAAACAASAAVASADTEDAWDRYHQAWDRYHDADAVACKGWRWMPGMRDEDGHTVVAVKYNGKIPYVVRWDADGQAACVSTVALPDLTDPATLGCLLSIVADAHGVSVDDVHVVRTTGNVWSVWIFRGDGSSYRVARQESSRAEALVAALAAGGEE